MGHNFVIDPLQALPPEVCHIILAELGGRSEIVKYRPVSRQWDRIVMSLPASTLFEEREAMSTSELNRTATFFGRFPGLKLQELCLGTQSLNDGKIDPVAADLEPVRNGTFQIQRALTLYMPLYAAQDTLMKILPCMRDLEHLRLWTQPGRDGWHMDSGGRAIEVPVRKFNYTGRYEDTNAAGEFFARFSFPRLEEIGLHSTSFPCEIFRTLVQGRSGSPGLDLDISGAGSVAKILETASALGVRLKMLSLINIPDTVPEFSDSSPRFPDSLDLSCLESLQSLNLGSTSLSNEEVGKCIGAARLQNLTKLVLDRMPGAGETGPLTYRLVLERCPNLEELSFFCFKVTATDLEAFARAVKDEKRRRGGCRVCLKRMVIATDRMQDRDLLDFFRESDLLVEELSGGMSDKAKHTLFKEGYCKIDGSRRSTAKGLERYIGAA